MPISDHRELKKAYEALKLNEIRTNKLLDSLSIGVGYYDLNGKVIQFNQKAAENMGGKPEDFVGKTMFDLFGDEYGKIYDKRLKDSIKSNVVMEYEDEIDLSGGTKWFLSQYFPIKENEKVTGVQIISTDITEHKHILNEVRNLNKTLQAAQEMAKIGYWSFDIKTQMPSWSDQMFKVTGFKKEDGVPAYMDHKKTWHPDDWEMFDAAVKACEKGTPYNIVVRIWSSEENSYHYVNTQGFPKRDSSGKIVELFGTSQDITEIKEAEIAIKEREEKYRNLIDSMMNAFALHEMIFDKKGNPVDYRFLEVNPAWEKVVGIKGGSVIGKTVREIMPDIEESWIELCGRIVKTGVPEDFEDYNQATDKYYHVYAYRPEEGKFAVFFNDVSKRKKIELKILESEEKYRFAMEASRDGIWDWDIKNNSVFYSQGWKNILDIKEVEPVLNTWEKRLHPEDRERVLTSLRKHVSGNTDYWIMDHRLLKGNEWIWVQGRGQVVKRDKKGKALRMVGTMTDIHERMLSRKELIKQKNFLDSVITNSPLPTWISDAKGKVIRVNPALLDTLNLKEEEVVGVYNILKDKNIQDAGHMPLVHEVFQKQHSVKFTLFWEKEQGGIPSEKGGRDVYVDATLFPIADDNHELQYVVCQWMDISEQKEAEQEIKESRERYRALYENAPLCYQSLNIDGYFNDVNPTWLTTLGYDRDEVIGASFSSFLHPDFKEHFEVNFPAFKERGYVHDVHFKLRHKKGHYLDVSFEGCIGYDADGKMKQTYCVFKDITLEVKATKALKESEEKYRLLVENQNDLIVKFDSRTNTILFASPNYLKVFGKKEEEVINKNFMPLIHEDDRERVKASIASLKTPPHTSYHEERAMTADGWRWLGWSLNASTDASGQITETVAVGRDITDRKAIESQVEQLSRFPDENPNPVLRVSQDGHILFSNPASKQVLNSLTDKSKTTLNSTWKNIVSRVFSEKSMQKRELELEDRIYVVNIVPVPEHAYVNLYLDDITEERKAEKEKDLTQSRYSELVNTINSGVAIYKVINDGRSGNDYIIQDFNHTALKHEQLTRDEVVGKSLKDIRPNIDEYGLIDIFRQVWKSGEPAFYPAKIYQDDKYANFYENRVFRLPNHEIVAIYDDVTERERAAEKIKESEERFDLAMKATSDGIYDWNLVTNEIYYSPGWKSMLGYDYDELPNDFSVWETLTEAEDVKRSWEMQQKVVNGELDRFEMEFKMKHKDGHWVDILSRAEAVFDENGKAIRMIGTHMDISNTKKFEKQLKSALNKAQESDRLKSAFLANMSHEIRTPMNGILGFSNLLKQADVGFEKRKEYIDIIQQSGKRMMNTINDLINISRIESGQVECHNSYLNLNTKMEDLYHFFKLDAEEKGLELSFVTGLDKDKAQIYSDPEKIYAIMSNFISNAIKFTRRGSITFGYQVHDEQIKLFVKDTGKGIKQDFLDHIFDRFAQADLELSRGYEGSGLGLSISKAYADVLGGDIKIDSEPGLGSTFYLYLPYTRQETSKEEEDYVSAQKIPTENDFSDLNVLIAEDDEASVLYMEMLLSEHFKTIQVCTSGKEVIERIKDDPDIDLILMDIKMPLLDGFSATKEIRKFNRKVKIIAQTAYAMESDNEKAMQAGCDGYISKPIDEEKLFALINKVFK